LTTRRRTRHEHDDGLRVEGGASVREATIRSVREPGGREALEEAVAVLRGEGEPGHAGEFISVNHAQELVSDLIAVTPNTDTKENGHER
jgi:hypothetical protein